MSDSMKLQTTQAIFANGKLIFLDPQHAPRNGVEVVITYLEQSQESDISTTLQALRGRGKGENLVERLLQSRQEDRLHDEQVANRLVNPGGNGPTVSTRGTSVEFLPWYLRRNELGA